MIKYLAILFLLIGISSFSQEYKPLDTTDFKHRTSLSDKYKTNFELVRKKLKKTYRGKKKKEILNSYEKKHARFLVNLNNKEFVFNPVFTNYIDSITETIVKVNPSLKAENLKVHIGRYNAPNAYSMGEGIVVLNMGLFNFLESESQFVSVLTHEIAHQKLQHSANNVVYNAEVSTSKATKRKAIAIRRQKYNQYEKAFSVLKDMLYTNKKKHRVQEAEADKLGYEMFKKTDYNKLAFINALKLLGDLDSMPSISIDTLVYKKMFNLPNRPYNSDWIVKEKSKYNYFESEDKINKDSVKSHPEIPERIEKLKHHFPELKNSEYSPKVSKNGTFEDLQNIAYKESIANLYYLKKYGLSTYITLNRLAKNPDDEFYKEWLGKNFLALSKAKKEYRFSRYVDNVSREDQDKSYQQFLSFLWALSLSEMNEIGRFYSK